MSQSIIWSFWPFEQQNSVSQLQTFRGQIEISVVLLHSAYQYVSMKLMNCKL